MRILLERKAEVADIRLLIDGLRQRTNHQSLEQNTVGPRDQPLHQLAKLARGRLLGKCRAHLQRIQDLLQFGHPLLFGLAVNPVQASCLRETQCDRRFDVGGDHAFLDQSMRIVARHRKKSFDGAVAADARLYLAAAKIQRAARVTRALQRAVHGIQRLQRRAYLRRKPVARPCLWVLQVAPCLIVREPRVRANHRLIKPGARQLAGLADANVADKGQPIHLRHQGAQVIG